MLSVIIPNYNRMDLIQETLDSLLNQRRDDWEGIVVDDGSTDRSRETVLDYVRRDSRFRLLERPSDRMKGPSACRNVGFESARGDYVYYLDSDDLLDSHFCENISHQFEGDPRLDFIGVDLAYFTDSSRLPSEAVRPVSSETKSPSVKNSLEDEKMIEVKAKYAASFRDVPFRENFFHRTLALNTVSICWRRSFLERFPRHWPEDQRVGEDRVCYYRILTNPCHGEWSKEPARIYIRLKSASRGKADQLTQRINIDADLARQRLMTADRLTEAFRRFENFDNRSLRLILHNYLICERGVLSYGHKELGKEAARRVIALAKEFHQPKFARKARFFYLFQSFFRFHRIPMVEKGYALIRNLIKGKKR